MPDEEQRFVTAGNGRTGGALLPPFIAEHQIDPATSGSVAERAADGPDGGLPLAGRRPIGVALLDERSEDPEGKGAPRYHASAHALPVPLHPGMWEPAGSSSYPTRPSKSTGTTPAPEAVQFEPARYPDKQEQEIAARGTALPATQRILDALPFHAAVIDEHGSITGVNSAWREFGQANDFRATDDGVGQNYLAVCDRAAAGGCTDAGLVAAGIRAILEGARDEFQHIYECSGPEVRRHFRLRVRRLVEARGVRAVVLHEDVTDVRSAALHVGDHRFRSLVQRASDIITVVDADGTIRYISPAVERAMGYAPETLIGADAFSLIHPDAVESVRQVFRQGPQQPDRQPEAGTFPVRHRDGSWRWLDGTITNLLDDPYVGGIVANLRDVSDRVRAQTALRFLAEASAILAESLDLEVTLSRVASLAVPHMADWCAVDTVGDDGIVRRVALAHADVEKVRLLEDLEREYPLDQSASFGMPNVLRTGRPEFYPDLNQGAGATRHDWRYATIMERLGNRSYICVPLAARGRTLGAITLVYADSGRRYDETDLQTALDLARRAALAVENARLYQQAQEALDIRNHFLSIITHDLRQPVATIKAAGEILHQTLDDGEGSDETWLVEKVERGAALMDAMIGELVDVARMQTGRDLDLRREEVDLTQLIQQVVAHDIRLHVGRDRIQLDEADGPAIACVDALRIERVLVNLIGNAIKYSPDGGVVRVSLQRATSDGRPQATITVADHGIGIPPADLPFVFDLFQRGRNVVGQFKGTGIGLAGAKHIVEQHGGSLVLASVLDKGTTATVSLPLAG
jgi:PAS domain S-box-containing protein